MVREVRPGPAQAPARAVLIDWSIEWSIDWWIEWSIDWRIDWSIDWWLDWCATARIASSGQDLPIHRPDEIEQPVQTWEKAENREGDAFVQTSTGQGWRAGVVISAFGEETRH